MRWPWKRDEEEPKRPSPAGDDEEFMVEALACFKANKEYWSDVRDAYNEDARFVNVEGGQWNPTVKAHRENVGKPTHEFNELHTYVEQVVNKARQNRPQPKVDPGDDLASQETADFWGGRLRHIQYASQADVAYDTAVDCAGTGGLGFYAVDVVYVDGGHLGGKPTFRQEPRIVRILDPMTEYPDKNVLQPDFSDAMNWFSRWWIPREDYRKKYPGKEPLSFDKDSDDDWSRDDMVCLAKYWKVTEKTRRWVALDNGDEGYKDEVEQPEGAQIVNERDVIEREVVCHIIDGEKKLSSTDWIGDWIPRIPVLGREVVVEGERILQSIVRFAKGSQKLKNANKNAVANLLQLVSSAPVWGPKGMFRDRSWQDAHLQNYAFLEWDPVYDKNDTMIPAKPERATFEAPIQAYTAAGIQCSDDIKRAVGYSDSILQPSHADLSGKALDRRQEGVNLTNFHFEDNLVRSQWHCARVVLDLDMKLVDTPRMLRARKEDGSSWAAPVTPAPEEGQAPALVQGKENDPHHLVGLGQYDVVVVPSQGYETKIREETDFLLEAIRGNPNGWQLYGDRIFALKGYKDLEERAKLALPPAIQQSMQAKDKHQDPQAMAAIAAANQRIQQLTGFLQKVVTMLQTKQIETKGKLDVEKLKLIRELIVTQAQHSHDAAGMLLGERTDAIEHLMTMLGESAQPDPAQPGAPAAAAPAQ